MQATHSNRTRPYKRRARLSLVLWESICVPKRQKIIIENIPQSIFELGDPDCHKAFVLNNQALFKEIQQKLITIIDEALKNNPDFFNKETASKTRDITDLSKKNIKWLETECLKLISQDNTIKGKFNLCFEPIIEFGIGNSKELHKDDAFEIHNKKNIYYDYTITIPILNYDVSDNKNHNLTPTSTVVVPHKFRDKIQNSTKKACTPRETAYLGYPTEDNKKYLVASKLEQGTGLIFRTATEAGSDDDGKSVIHMSPKTEENFVRVLLVLNANKII